MPKQTSQEALPKTEQKTTVETLHAIIEKQSLAIETLLEDNKKIKRRLFFIALGSNIRLVLFLIPLILTLIYVVPFLQNNWESMQSILDMTKSGKEQGAGSLFEQISKEGINISTLLQEYERMKAQ